MSDDSKPTFDELRDAMMPPGTDKDALWAALKGAHRTGGHVPGRPAPDISGAVSPQLLDMLQASRMAEVRPCPVCATHHASGTPCPPRIGPAAPGTHAYYACTICGNVHDKHLPCADLSIPDPFTKGSEAAAGLAEMYEDLLASGIPLASVERILGAMLATYGAMTKDEP